METEAHEIPSLGCEDLPGGTLVWLMGRGLSIGCGLSWAVPAEWASLPRETRVARIKETLIEEMTKPSVDTSDIRMLLLDLAHRTMNGWRHKFVTTNWDTLLQREIDRLDLKVLPRWLSSSGVAHLNGVVEDDHESRSPFLLETDSAHQRKPTAEADKAFNHLIWQRHFVVVGMSFECSIDKGFLRAFNTVKDGISLADYLPIGESNWLVINPNPCELATSGNRIREALSAANVELVQNEFGPWLQDALPELQNWGVLRAHVGGGGRNAAQMVS